MTFLQGIREKTGRYILKKKIRRSSRTKEFINLEDATRIGVIFHQTDYNSFESVQKFLKKLAEDGKQIFAIGFIEKKEIPQEYVLKKGFNFFCLKELNWYFKPEPVFVADFIERDFDLLINLSIDNVFPVDYIFALSNARFKVGKYSAEYEFADLSIDIKKSGDIDYLIMQISHYLSEINVKKQ
ncbi:MAG: DUF6913 domain-containing protein [Bacteroidales bacterium]